MKKTTTILSLLSIVTFFIIMPVYSDIGHIKDIYVNNNIDIDIDDIVIDSQRELDLVRDFDPGEGIATLANINGHIVGVNNKPVYVTLRIGGQSYTTLTSAKGYFSFLVYATKSKYSLEAWSYKTPTVKNVTSTNSQVYLATDKTSLSNTHLTKNFNLKK